MSGSSTTFQPTGRGELLLWINGVCSAQYPSVESLRDGVAYCTIVDAAVSRVAENCKVLGVPEAHIAQKRARQSSQLLARLEWDVTLATCSNQEPSLDSMQERDHCEKNFHTLQLMLRGCVSPEFSLEINVSRLAKGKLQEHVMLLKWMYQFMTKMLSTYSKSALEQRINASVGAGRVEGVRLTRTMKLQQRRIREKYVHLASPESMPRRVSDPERNVDVENNYSIPEDMERNRAKQVSQSAISVTGNAVLPSVVKRYEAPLDSQTIDAGEKKRHHQRPHAQVSRSETQFGGSSRSSMNGCSRSVVFAVPHAYSAMLTDLRQDVESYERLVLAAHRRHQRCLTGSENAVGEEEESSANMCGSASELPPKKAPMISLKQVGVLLEERDKLWQTFEVLQDAFVRCSSTVGQRDWDCMSTSPLVAKILATLSPQ